MNKSKLFGFTTIALLLINLTLVGFIFFRKPPHSGQHGPRNIIIEKLHFDENQIKSYDKLIDWHRGEIKKADAEIMLLKNKLYRLVLNDSIENQKDTLISELSMVHSKIENIHFKHFVDIKKLCNVEQKQAFENLTLEIAELFSGPPKGLRK